MVIHIGTEEEAHVFVKHLRCDQLHNTARFGNVRKSRGHIWATLQHCVSCVVCVCAQQTFSTVASSTRTLHLCPMQVRWLDFWP